MNQLSKKGEGIGRYFGKRLNCLNRVFQIYCQLDSGSMLYFDTILNAVSTLYLAEWLNFGIFLKMGGNKYSGQKCCIPLKFAWTKAWSLR